MNLYKKLIKKVKKATDMNNKHFGSMKHLLSLKRTLDKIPIERAGVCTECKSKLVWTKNLLCTECYSMLQQKASRAKSATRE